MAISHTKLPGLDATKLVEVVETVLSAHHVDGVELVWKNDHTGMVLELTVERPGSRVPGQGITVDVCADISRDLSAALDVHDLIVPRYQLIVGSPGVERNLYQLEEYRRFSGQVAKLKLNGPLASEGNLAKVRALRGTLFGITEKGEVEIETEQGTLLVPFDRISSGRLVFEIQKTERPGQGPKKGSKTSKKKLTGDRRTTSNVAEEARRSAVSSEETNTRDDSGEDKLEH